MDVKDLKPNPRNPRKISDDQKRHLKKSLEKYGDLGGIVFNRRRQTLCGGHQRTAVLPPTTAITIEKQYDSPTKTGTVAEGYIEINGERFRYREVDWDQTTEESANLAANKLGGEWDYPLLTDVLIDLKDAGVDVEDLGFVKKELDALLGDEAKRIIDESKIHEEQFVLSILCKDELEIEDLFTELKSRGFTCKIIT